MGLQGVGRPHLCRSAPELCTERISRYVTLVDSTGSVGVTVWNENVAKISGSDVGKGFRMNLFGLLCDTGAVAYTVQIESVKETFDAARVHDMSAADVGDAGHTASLSRMRDSEFGGAQNYTVTVRPSIYIYIYIYDA